MTTTRPAKHILFLVSSMQGGGAERVAALLSNYWAEQGHRVTLMPTFSGRGECLYPLDPGVKLDFLADRVGAARKTPWTLLRRFLALRRVIKTERPDVVLSFLTHVNVAAILAARGSGVPVIVSERIHPLHTDASALWKWARKRTYPMADLTIVQTRAAEEWMRANIPRARCALIPNPVVLPAKAGTAVSIPAPGRHLLLAAGRLDPQKGFDLLINAFNRVSSLFPDWDLCILGEGVERPNLEALRNTLDLSDRVHLPGRVDDMADRYARADLFALSSRYEGFPNVLLEALASGLPAVSFDCPSGPADIIRHETDGLLVEPESTDKLAAALARLMGEVALRARFAARAVEAKDRFSLERIGPLWDAALGLPPTSRKA